MHVKFVADRMLGKLARWLRGFGLDVYYDDHIDRAKLIRIAREQDRLILTKARNFGELKHIPPYLILNDDLLEAQLGEIFRAFPNLSRSGFEFTRCLICNIALESIEKKEVIDKVPPKVFQSKDRFKICPSCKRTYWEGTHTDKMKKLMKKFLTE